MSRKPILCLDFDGVIHSYTSGWKGADVIPDPPVPGAMAFIIEACLSFDLHIYSSRSGQRGGIPAMQDFIYEAMRQELHGLYKTQEMVDQRAYLKAHRTIKWPTEKPPAMITIDDRALTFTGVWPTIAELKSFQPWNKRGKPQADLVADVITAGKHWRDQRSRGDEIDWNALAEAESALATAIGKL